MRTAILLLVLCVSPLAGCLIEPDTTPEAFDLWTPVHVTIGYAYDGEGSTLLPFDGSRRQFWPSEMPLRIRLDPLKDTGQVSVVVHGADSCDGIRWDSFHGTHGYQQGGIAQDVQLHGNTGHDAADFPRVKAKVAAWGVATLFANSVLWSSLPEPISQWDAHLMVIEQGIRDEYAIRNSTTGFYDPARPDDAAKPSGPDEVHLRLRSRGPNAGGFDIGATPFNARLHGADQEQTHTFWPPPGRGVATVAIQLQPGQVEPAAQLRVTAERDGRVLATATVTAQSPKAQLQFLREQTEAFTLRAHGNGVGASYQLMASLHVEELVINMWGGALSRPEGSSAPWVPSEETCGIGQMRAGRNDG